MDCSLVNCLACRIPSREKSMRPFRQSSFSHLTIMEKSLSTVDVPWNAVANPLQKVFKCLNLSRALPQPCSKVVFASHWSKTCFKAGLRSYAEQRYWKSSSMSLTCCGVQHHADNPSN